jgi:glucose/arabinose dehydrogenase
VLEPLDSTFDQPLHLTHAGDGSGRLFVVEKIGIIQVVQEGQKRPDPFLDIRSKVNAQASERGLLSVAFHPAYETNGQFFVNYTNQDGHTVVARYHVSSDPNVADPASEEVILTIEQPAANHNGGQVAFGPDGYLYIGMGDGGAAGDPWGNAQNGAALLGKLLRIDVDSGSDSSVLYGIPPDNPFLQRSDVRPEIWALGLRNPWRFSFDRVTGDLYIADVGQNQYEELNFQPARSKGGENYGWNRMEGNACYPEGEPCQQEELEMPVLVYSHQGSNCSITGGFVYRGSAFPAFQGIYFFADYCSGKVWTLCKTLGGWQSALMLDTGMSISSFGEDEAGELYLTTLWEGKVYQVMAGGDTREE